MNYYRFYKDNQHAVHATATILVAAALLWLGWVTLIPTPALEVSQRVHVGTGQSLTAISKTLKGRGIVRSAILFRVYIQALGAERNLKAGDYTIPAESTFLDIASQITGGRGSSNDIAVFIPEGYNVWEIDKRLADSGLITEGEFASAYGSREGFMFPDTYRFKKGSLLLEIEQKMEENGIAKTQELIGGLSAPARDRIITIASIIEKEARDEGDMYLVSGVIANRLKRGMALAIDATVDYGACLRMFSAKPTVDCQTSQVAVGKEIHIDSEFNSYLRAGLPRHPISNPGLTSIQAALNPRGDYLYYLSTRDGSQTIFEKTAAEHEANRRKYLGL
jgi:UPF0755 protein